MFGFSIYICTSISG